MSVRDLPRRHSVSSGVETPLEPRWTAHTTRIFPCFLKPCSQANGRIVTVVVRHPEESKTFMMAEHVRPAWPYSCKKLPPSPKVLMSRKFMRSTRSRIEPFYCRASSLKCERLALGKLISAQRTQSLINARDSGYQMLDHYPHHARMWKDRNHKYKQNL